MAEEKTKFQKLEEKLVYKSKNVWEEISEKEKKEVFELSDDYKNFLNQCKTERETVQYFIKKAEKDGYQNIENFKGKAKPFDKFYFNWKNKSLALITIGEKDFEEGISIVGGHVDVPRLDLKQNPLYEDNELALLKTHYYGGIKKYQWLNIPLALHGVIILDNGEKKTFTIGEDDNDPVFIISDLLPHLSRKVQGEKKLLTGIDAENMVILFGNIPVNDKKVKNKVKLAVLEKLNEKYGIKEEDFISAEIEVVPAFKAKDVGIDRSMIAAYGHDDRVCSYLAAESHLSVKKPVKTTVALLVDKEEIGSTGNTGSDSYMLYHLYTMIAELYGKDNLSSIRKSLMKSACISSDVAAAVNPPYKMVHDLQNAALFSHGIAILKFTGSGGKYTANDADAEYFGSIRKLFNENKVFWQYTELGKVDEGGGGTIAKYVAYFGISTFDAGIPVIGMHSPYEIISKADLWSGYKAYKVFYEKYGK